MKNLLHSKQSDNTFFQWVWNLENLWTGNCTSHWVKTWREVLPVFQVNQMLPLYHRGIICSDFQRRPANHLKLFVKTRLNWLVTLANSIYMWILILWDFKDWFINLTFSLFAVWTLYNRFQVWREVSFISNQQQSIWIQNTQGNTIQKFDCAFLYIVSYFPLSSCSDDKVGKGGWGSWSRDATCTPPRAQKIAQERFRLGEVYFARSFPLSV